MRVWRCVTALLDERGQGLVEYAMILLCIVLAVTGTVALIGPHVRTFFQHAAACLGNPTGC